MHMSKQRPGRAPPLLRGRRCAPDRRIRLGQRLPFSRPVPTAPLEHPTGGGHLHEASTEVHSRSPIPTFSSPVTPGWNGSPWASSPSFAPRSHPRRTSGRRRATHALARVLHLRHQPNLQTVPPTSLMHPHVARSRRWIRSPHTTPAGRADAHPAPGSRRWSTPTWSPSSTCRVDPAPEPAHTPWRLSSTHQFPRTADE